MNPLIDNPAQQNARQWSTRLAFLPHKMLGQLTFRHNCPKFFIPFDDDRIRGIRFKPIISSWVINAGTTRIQRVDNRANWCRRE